MKNYRLIIFRFKYTDSFRCFWPIYFEVDAANNYGEFETEILQQIKDNLNSQIGITEMEVMVNKLATLDECEATLTSLLSTHPIDDEVKIKYLEIEIQTKLSDEPKFDYDNWNYFIPVEISREKIPVRVRALNFKFLLDDLELPLVVIELES